MEVIRELYIVLEDKPDVLGEILTLLRGWSVNLEAFSVNEDTARFLVEDTERVAKLLEKNKYQVEVREALRIEIENEPGALAFVASKLGSMGIKIECCYGTIAAGQGRAAIIMDVSDLKGAASLFRA